MADKLIVVPLSRACAQLLLSKLYVFFLLVQFVIQIFLLFNGESVFKSRCNISNIIHIVKYRHWFFDFQVFICNFDRRIYPRISVISPDRIR